MKILHHIIIFLFSALQFLPEFVDSNDPCDEGMALVSVEVYTDNAPEETVWELQDVLDGGIVASGGPYSKSLTLYKEQMCLDPKTSCLKFSVIDWGRNGLCCSNGKGSVRVSFEHALVFEDSAFGMSSVSESFGDACPSKMLSTSSSGPTVTPQPTSFPIVVTAQPSLQPTVFREDPSNSMPSYVPSIEPSNSLTASPSYEPTVFSCEDGLALLELKLKTDQYPSETSWKIQDTLDESTVHNSDPYTEEETLHEENICLEMTSCYIFSMLDSENDGICCGYGYGYIRLYFQGILIMEGGIFLSSIESIKFGDGCSSESPSISLKNPSNEPSFTMKPSLSLFPSISSNPSSTPSISLAPTSVRAVRKGTFSVAVIRVTGADGFTPSKTAAEISDDVFGTNGDPLNPVVALQECSGGQTMIATAEGEEFEGGVMELTLAQDVEDVGFDAACSYAIAQLSSNGIALSDYKKLFIILPVEIGDGVANNEENGRISCIVDSYASYHYLLTNTLGHGFYVSASSALDGTYFGDDTCMMGTAPFADDAPHMCFNGAKSWWFGWYSERHITVNPTLNSFCGKMISVHDYMNGEADAGDQFTVLRILEPNEIDLYVMFNRAEGANAEVGGSRNQVTIVQQDGDFGRSYFQAGLDVGLEWVKDDWNGSGKRLVIRVCSIMYGSPDDALILVYVEGMNDLDCGSIEPSSFPSDKPSEIPTSKPSLSSLPTISSNPSWSPTYTSQPSQGTTMPPPINFSTDSYGRRHFPAKSDQGENDIDFEQIPNCSELGFIGCLGLPSNTLPPPPPEWSGKLYFTPPTCKQRGRKRVCDYGLPMSRNVYPSLLSKFELDDNSVADLVGANTDTQSVVLGDVDGDGKIDMVFGEKGSPNRIHYNKGDGSFEPVNLPGGNGIDTTLSVAIGDMNGDDLPDIIVGNYGDPNQLLLNLGGRGQFEVYELPGGSSATRSIAIGDLDGDGRLDVVEGNSNDQSNVLFLNKGDQNFDYIELPNSSTRTYFVAMGDMDRNNKVDIVFGNYDSPNKLHLNHGDNNFEQVELPNNEYSRTESLAIGDVNGDGDLDLVIGNYGQPNILLKNRGNVTFIVEELPGGNRFTLAIVLCDLDGNGLADVVIGNDDEVNQVVMNQGDKKHILFDLPGGALSTNSLAAGNAANPGRTEIIIANGDDQNQIISNNIGKDFSLLEFPTSLIKSWRATIGDFDKNGHTDLVFGNEYQLNQLALNQGDGSFSLLDIPGELHPTYSLTTGDLDGDDTLDIVVAYPVEENHIFFNVGNASFNSFKLPGEQTYTYVIAVADLNGDGRLDIVEGNWESPNYLWINMGEKTFDRMELPGGAQHTYHMTICDMNEDDRLDLLIGNEDEPNQLLINKEDKRFDLMTLPGGSTHTSHISAGDVNKDNNIDILIMNEFQPNQLLLNDGDGSFTVSNLPGGSKFTKFAALGDLDGNGFLDVVIANKNQHNQILWNWGDTKLEERNLPGDGMKETYDCKIVDLNGDGASDILFINYNGLNEALLYNPIGKSCDNGGAQLHSGSWCFECPSYMGRPTFLGQEVSTCVECLPDHEQANFVEQCNPFPCPFAHRPMGSDTCVGCPSSTYYNSTIERTINEISSLSTPRCHECPPGHYSDGSVLAIDECFQCSSGSHQPKSGQSSCIQCEKGSFQPDRGQGDCIQCEVGGFCDAIETCGGGFTSCPQGTYNEKKGQSDMSACTKCPAGTFSTAVGADSITMCEPCPKGSYTNEDGQTQCQQCVSGTFQPNEEETSCLTCPAGSYSTNETNCLPCPSGSYTNKERQTQCQLCLPGLYQPNENQKTCLPCAAGTYASNPGLIECTRCPSRLHSTTGSETCSFCQEGYYLNGNNEVEMADIFEKPDNFCLICPLHAECPVNTTLETLVVPSNFWRDSKSSATLYECNNAACQGSQRRTSTSGDYCSTGHTGPLCEVCVDSSYYFSSSDGRCESCPSLLRLLIPVAIILAIVAAFIASRCIKGFKDFIDRLILASSRINFQAKLKVLISFYQVVNTLEDVYGVTIDERLKGWFDFLQYFNFGLIEVSTIPGKCFGSMTSRLVLSALWPYFVALVIFVATMIYIIIAHKKRRNSQPNDTTSLSSVLWMKLLSITIITSYLAMPTVCRSIFDAIKCQSFDTNDELGLSNSYLIADWNIKCGQESRDHQVLLRIFWVLFTLWPIFVPLAFLALLLQVRGSVQSKSITTLAEACSFLWRDYTEATMFWEVIDLIRKIFLTGLIMFIDIEEGSTKILRLIIASIVSTFYLSILAYARPYKRKDDLYLAFISNLLLICCFVLGIAIQLCHNNDDVCHDFIGLSLNSYRASVLAVIVTAAMLIATVVLMIILGINVITTPTIKVISTGKVPNLELSESCKFHIFVSHIWATGQDKTHSMVRNLQLLIPGIQIWLDVNNLSDIGDLEKSVEESTVFVLFYTKGYFASVNCRREVNTALAKRKPTIVLFEKYGEIDEMKQECEQNCPDNFQQILDHIFTEDPVMWLGRSPLYYAVESTKVFCRKILPHLPYYTRNSDLLTDGLKIKSELGEVALPKKSYRIFYCSENKGADVLVEEIVGIVATKDDVSSAEVDTVLSGSTTLNAESDFFILYLNNDIFTDSGGQMKEKVKSAIQSGINIILIHEQDPEKLGVEFKVIMGKTPAELMRLKLYNDMALPLHTFEDYRRISLSQVLCKLGARPKNLRPRYRITFGLNSAAGGVASANPNPRRRLNVSFGQSVRQINQNFRRRFSMRRQSGGEIIRFE